FFYLEQEVMKPRYEIHSIGMPEIVEPVEKGQVEQRDRAARALFSATEMVNSNKFETEFGRTVPTTKYGEYATRYQKSFTAQVRRVSENVSRAYAQGHGDSDLGKIIGKMAAADGPELRDSWGNKLRIEPVQWNKAYYLVHSAGPDKQFNTGDDLATYLEIHHRKIVGRKSSGPSAIDVNVEHERGPFNSHAEITGTAMDQWGGALEGTTVRAQEVSTGRARTAVVNANGQFRIANLQPGDYRLEVMGGSENIAKTLKLEARDRAVLSVYLRKESSGTVIAVNGELGMLADIKLGEGFGAGRGAG